MLHAMLRGLLGDYVMLPHAIIPGDVASTALTLLPDWWHMCC